MKKHSIMLLFILLFILTSCGHTHQFTSIITKESNCGFDGELTITCTTCGETRKEVILKSGNHSFGEYAVTKEPTCSENGLQTSTCSVCGETKTEEIPPIEHSYEAVSVIKEPSCSEEGIRSIVCSVCGFESSEPIEKKEHSFDEGKTTKEPSCIETGLKTLTCTECGAEKEEIVEIIDHTFDAGTVTVAATCSSEGQKTYKCSVCGATKTESVPKKNHTFDNGTITTEPTASSTGIKTFKCTVCGETKTEVVEQRQSAYDYLYNYVKEKGEIGEKYIYDTDEYGSYYFVVHSTKELLIDYQQDFYTNCYAAGKARMEYGSDKFVIMFVYTNTSIKSNISSVLGITNKIPKSEYCNGDVYPFTTFYPDGNAGNYNSKDYCASSAEHYVGKALSHFEDKILKPAGYTLDDIGFTSFHD